MLINLSNHPYSSWSDSQSIAAIDQFGEVVDLAFPIVSPSGDENYVRDLATTLVTKINQLGNPSDITVHLMGEMTLTFCLVTILKEMGFKCIASTTERIVSQNPDGTKNVNFNFERFRFY